MTELKNCGIPVERVLINCGAGSQRGLLSATAWLKDIVCVHACARVRERDGERGREREQVTVICTSEKWQYSLSDMICHRFSSSFMGKLHFCEDLRLNTQQSLTTP